MNYKFDSQPVSKEITVNPCIKCGSDNLMTYNCGYSSFNCAGVKCKDCKHEVTEHVSSWMDSDAIPQAVKRWNKENPTVLQRIASKQEQLDKIPELKKQLRQDIKALKSVQKKKEPSNA